MGVCLWIKNDSPLERISCLIFSTPSAVGITFAAVGASTVDVTDLYEIHIFIIYSEFSFIQLVDLFQ